MFGLVEEMEMAFFPGVPFLPKVMTLPYYLEHLLKAISY